jgi:hypothetical protein
LSQRRFPTDGAKRFIWLYHLFCRAAFSFLTCRAGSQC